MVFSSLEFLFVFLPVFLIGYSIAPPKYRNVVIVIGSLVFYGFGVADTPVYLLLMFLTIVLNFSLGRLMQLCRRDAKIFLISGIVFNFGWLIYFKYMDFFISNINALFPALSLPLTNALLPIGISFYTFQNVSYLVDVYKQKTGPETSLVRYGAYISMFPQLIAGPIVTYDSVAQQLRNRKHSLEMVNEGLRTFTIGLGSKVLLANQLGGLWKDIAMIGFESISTPLAWMGIAAYSLQLYFDFYGYSLMAIGLGQLMGFQFPRNFNHPYTAVTMTDFWRRWHITLGSWFREYVYIPLGGNRLGTAKTIRNLLIVWLLTGFWHGASWNFVLWGAVLFLILVLEKFCFGNFMEQHKCLGHLYMLLLIPLTWLIFAVTDLSSLVVYVQRLFPFLSEHAAAVFPEDYLKYFGIYGKFLLAGLLFSTRIPSLIYGKLKNSLFMSILLLIVFYAAVYCMYQGMDDPFLYFRF